MFIESRYVIKEKIIPKKLIKRRFSDQVHEFIYRVMGFKKKIVLRLRFSVIEAINK